MEDLNFDLGTFDTNNNSWGGDLIGGFGDYVKGWGANSVSTAEYNAAQAAALNENTLSKRKLTDAIIKIVGFLVIVVGIVLIIKAFKK